MALGGRCLHEQITAFVALHKCTSTAAKLPSSTKQQPVYGINNPSCLLVIEEGT